MLHIVISSGTTKWLIDKNSGYFFQKYPDLLVDFSGLIFEAEDSGDFNNLSQPMKILDLLRKG